MLTALNRHSVLGQGAQWLARYEAVRRPARRQSEGAGRGWADSGKRPHHKSLQFCSVPSVQADSIAASQVFQKAPANLTSRCSIKCCTFWSVRIEQRVLFQVDTKVFSTGQCLSESEYTGLHKVGNASDTQPAVSFHIYSPPYVHCCYASKGGQQQVSLQQLFFPCLSLRFHGADCAVFAAFCSLTKRCFDRRSSRSCTLSRARGSTATCPVRPPPSAASPPPPAAGCGGRRRRRSARCVSPRSPASTYQPWCFA